MKYGPVLKFISIEKNDDGSINHVKVEILPDFTDKLKGHIHWVSKENSLNVKLNLYDVHFKSLNVGGLGDKWREDLNPDSLIVKNNSKIWKLHNKANVDDRFQFERLGYFVINEASNPKKGKFEFNRIVELKASKPKGN